MKGIGQGGWPKAGRPRLRRRLWSGTLTPLADGATAFDEGGPAALIFEQSRGGPVLGEAQQAALRAAVQEVPSRSGIGMANWNWKVVHQFVSERFGISLSRGSCLNSLHRLGFVLKRPKKHLVKAYQGKVSRL